MNYYRSQPNPGDESGRGMKRKADDFRDVTRKRKETKKKRGGASTLKVSS